MAENDNTNSTQSEEFVNTLEEIRKFQREYNLQDYEAIEIAKITYLKQIANLKPLTPQSEYSEEQIDNIVKRIYCGTGRRTHMTTAKIIEYYPELKRYSNEDIEFALMKNGKSSRRSSGITDFLIPFPNGGAQ